MNPGEADKKAEMPELELWQWSRRNRRGATTRSASRGTVGPEHKLAAGMKTETGEGLMEAILTRENMTRALKAVERNKGAAGVDKMTIAGLRSWLKENWPEVKRQLLAGEYRPAPVRRVDIPKPGGGTRMLGIPTVLDRLIQQAIHQVLSPLWEPHFSDHSYGFRPGRSAHQAVSAARAHMEAGHRWVVDLDLEKFFDRVNHDVLMSRLQRRISDRVLLKLIRAYLQSGIMTGGLIEQRVEGTPQGGPLSPLLSNILLDDLDKELEARGHRFCRYADDCNIYVKSRRAGERVLAGLTRFLEKRLKLKVNQEKSRVDRPWNRKFLGYTVTTHRKPRVKAAPAAIKRFKASVRALFRQGRGRNLGRFIAEDLNPRLRGWANYYRLAEVKGIFEELDSWLRRKLRCLLWRQWKRVITRARRLMARGLSEERAWTSATNGRGPWWNAGASHMNAAFPAKYFRTLGLISLLDTIQSHQKHQSHS